MKKRLLSALLAVCLVVGMVPATLLTANAATAVKITEVSANLAGIDEPVAGAKVEGLADLTTAVTVNAWSKGSGASLETGSSDPTGFGGLTVSTSVSGAEKRTDGEWYWKAGQVATITMSVKAYSADPDYTFSVSVPSSNNGTTNGWYITYSGSTITAKYDFNGVAGIQTSVTKDSSGDPVVADTIPYLEDAASISGTFVDAQNPTTTDIDDPDNIELYVVKGQKATLYLNSLDEKGNKGGSISVVSGSVPTDIIQVSGSGNPATITVTGKMAHSSAVTFVLQTAKYGNCDVKQFTVSVTVVDSVSSFKLSTSATSAELSGTAPTLSATVTAGGTTETLAANDSSLSYKSSNEDVLTVTDGAITLVGAGTATITATYSDDDGNALATSAVTIQVIRDKVTIPVPQSKDYTYMSGEITFQWTTAPTESKMYLLLNGVQVDDASALTAVPAGRHTITASLKDADKDQWEDGTTADKTFTWQVDRKKLTDTTIEGVVTEPTYTGKAFVVGATDPAQELDLAVTDTFDDAVNSGELKNGVDFTVVSYTNNIYAGVKKASITINGKGNYTGTQTYTFTIKQVAAGTALSVATPLTKTAGSSVDLRTLLSCADIEGFDYTKLTAAGFNWVLDADSKTKATLTDNTLKLNSTLGAGAFVDVQGTYSGQYDANGDGYYEYTTVTLAAATPVKVNVAAKIQTVVIPTAPTGLVYNGKEQVGLANTNYYTVAGGKQTDANKYTATLTLDQSKAPAGTKLVWSDGTEGNQEVKWEIGKATPSVTVSFTPVLVAGKTINDVALSVRTAVGVNGEDLSDDAKGTLAWNAGSETHIVQDAGYEWTWTAVDTNYKNVSGSAVIWGDTDGTSDSDDKEEDEDEETTTTVNNPDGSTTEIKRNKETGVTTYTTTGTNGTSSKVVYTNNVLTSATATSSTNGAVAYVPLNSVTWGSVITLRGVDNFEAGLPASGLQGMWVTLPSGSSDLGLRNYSESFPDVSSGSWYAPAVTLASARDLIQGINGYFTPNGTLNFGQIWTMLSRYVGAVSLSQSSGANWYIQPQSWAYNNGISAGTYYADAATREDVAVMMYNTYARYKGTPSVSTSALSSMSDYGSVSYGARTAVAWAIQTGVIKGYPNSTFQPHNTILRQEAAHMMARFIYVMEGMDIPAEFAS